MVKLFPLTQTITYTVQIEFTPTCCNILHCVSFTKLFPQLARHYEKWNLVKYQKSIVTPFCGIELVYAILTMKWISWGGFFGCGLSKKGWTEARKAQVIGISFTKSWMFWPFRSAKTFDLQYIEIQPMRNATESTPQQRIIHYNFRNDWTNFFLNEGVRLCVRLINFNIHSQYFDKLPSMFRKRWEEHCSRCCGDKKNDSKGIIYCHLMAS